MATMMKTPHEPLSVTKAARNGNCLMLRANESDLAPMFFTPIKDVYGTLVGSIRPSVRLSISRSSGAVLRTSALSIRVCRNSAAGILQLAQLPPGLHAAKCLLLRRMRLFGSPAHKQKISGRMPRDAFRR